MSRRPPASTTQMPGAGRFWRLDRLNEPLHTERVWSAGASMSKKTANKGRKTAKAAVSDMSTGEATVEALLAHGIATV